MSASGTEAYVTVQSSMGEISVLARLSKAKGTWEDPQLLSFSGKFKDLEPALAPDGLRLYFASNRPMHNTEYEPKDFDIWYVERPDKDSPWGDPVNLGAPVNTEHNEFFPSVALNGNLYFTSDRNDSHSKDDIYIAVWQRGQYLKSAPLNGSVNTDGYEFNAFIAPDEAYLIFSGYNRADGFGSGDLYISFRENRQWGPAVNMGKKVNSAQMDYCPFVDAGSQTLFFTSKRTGLKEVNDFKSLEEVTREIGKYENGRSRIYQLGFEEIRNSLKEKSGH